MESSTYIFEFPENLDEIIEDNSNCIVCNETKHDRFDRRKMYHSHSITNQSSDNDLLNQEENFQMRRLQFARNLIGKDAELFWMNEDDKRFHKNQHDELKCHRTEHEIGSQRNEVTDWYDGHIVWYNASTNEFGVNFVGDTKDNVFMMNLTVDDVRPSIRAWIQRTNAIILADSPNELYNGSNLPPSSRIITNNDCELEKKLQENQDYYTKHLNYNWLDEEYADVLILHTLICEQILLYQQLSILGKNQTNDVVVRTTDDLKLLCSHLELIRECCEWYFGSKKILYQLLHSNPSMWNENNEANAFSVGDNIAGLNNENASSSSSSSTCYYNVMEYELKECLDCSEKTVCRLKYSIDDDSLKCCRNITDVPISKTVQFARKYYTPDRWYHKYFTSLQENISTCCFDDVTVFHW